MGSGVIQIFSLDIDRRSRKMSGKVFSKCEGSGPAGIGRHKIFIFLPESGVCLSLLKRPNELFEGRNEDLGDIGSPELSIIASFYYHLILLTFSIRSFISV
jgi:hypothetical protein